MIKNPQHRLYIEGQVIGVFFRAKIKQIAKELGLIGWVKNIYNNNVDFSSGEGVEIVVLGGENQIDQFIQKIKQLPSPIKIEKVTKKTEKKTKNYSDFKILY